MASYDKQKMVAILERRRTAFFRLRDLTERGSEARTTMLRMRMSIENNARERGATDIAARLLALPLHQALPLRQDDVEGYTVKRKDGSEERWRTGVDFGTWNKFQHAREKHERLVAAEAECRAQIDVEFAIVPNLLGAIREWGFPSPELEV